MMNRIYWLLLVSVTLMVSREVCAQATSINYDARTIAAMTSEYAAAAGAEGYYDVQVKDILAKYGVAEVATAGIFTSKFLERKALTDLGIWSSSTENHYYRRIYNLVSSKIIPLIWDVSGELLHYPHRAMYWGSYLVKVCTEVKALCMQFESVVTNSSLSFSDINFLELDPRFAAFMQFSKVGNADWQSMLDDFTKISGNFTVDNLKEDVGTLYSIGTQLATSGFDNLTGDLMGNSQFEGSFRNKAKAAVEVAKNVYDIYKESDGKMENVFRQYLGNDPTAADLFSFSSYNMTGWIDDYMNETKGSYYTQRWFIARTDAGSEVVCDYNPPTDDNSVLNTGEWVRFATNDQSFYPNSSQLEQVLSNSEQYARWSRAYINQLNGQNNGYTYSMSRSLLGYLITKGGRLTKKAYAYRIKVTKYWSFSEEVYEEVFDSYTMDLNTFKMKLNTLLSEYNDNEEGYVYQLKSGPRNYYQVADEAKLKGCESVVVSMTCTDNARLGEGATQYKCRQCGGSLDGHSKECAMRTTVAEESEKLDTSELELKKREYENELLRLKNDRLALETENKRLVSLMEGATEDERVAYNKQINMNNDRIAALDGQILQKDGQLKELQEAMGEAESDGGVTADDYYRIPAIMQDCRTAYNLTWQGDGWWSGYTYYRYANAPNIKGTITFQASLSIARKPKYFLGIKIHRAILKISWSLSATYSDTQVIDNIELDPDMGDAEKKKLVNDRISELAGQYPNCRLSTEYIKSETIGEDVSEDKFHLLWASDRLAVARQVEARLMNIYADLVSLKKMMHYKLTILDVLGDIAPYVNDEQGRKLTLAEKCRKRWLRNAAESHHSLHYNGKYEEEEDGRK